MSIIKRKPFAMLLSLMLMMAVCLTLIPSTAKAADYDDGDEVIVKLRPRTYKKTITIKKGDELYIVSKINGVEQDEESVLYRSNKRSVVKVSKDGTIKAKKTGKAKVTIKTTDGSKKATITVNVVNKKTSDASKVKGIWITSQPQYIKVGDTVQLKAETNPKTEDIKYHWESSDTSVAEVDSNGKVTGVAPGETIISASINGKSGSVRVTVAAK